VATSDKNYSVQNDGVSDSRWRFVLLGAFHVGEALKRPSLDLNGGPGVKGIKSLRAFTA